MTPRWVEFLLKYWSGVLGLSGVVIALVVFLATLPPRLSASEQKNVAQDATLTKLGVIAEQNQQLLDRWDRLYQQQTATQPAMRNLPIVQRKWDDEARRWYCDDGQQTWWVNREGFCD